MLTYLRLGGVDLHDFVEGAGARDVTRVAGLIGLGAPRGESQPLTEQHGSVNRGRWMSSKIVTIEGECWGTTISDAYDQYAIVEQAFYEALTNPAGSVLEWPRMDAADDLQAQVKLAGELLPPIEEGAALLRYQAQVEQMDPRAYSQTLKTIEGVALTSEGLAFPLKFSFDFNQGGGIVEVVNAGRIETPPVVRIFGPVTDPSYALDSSSSMIKVTGAIAAGDYLEVDHAKRTVKLNGSILVMDLLDAPASRFFDIPPGAHELRLLAPSFGVGAHLQVNLRDAYGG